MRIDLAHLEDQTLELHETLVVPVSRLDPALVAGPIRVEVDLRVRARTPGFELDGKAGMAGDLVCARCLASVPWSAREPFHFHLIDAASAPRDEDVRLERDDLDVEFFAGDSIDLMEVVAEQVLLSLPMRVLCSEDCAGVCPTCGANRNQAGACNCVPQTDPRWQALADFEPRRS